MPDRNDAYNSPYTPHPGERDLTFDLIEQRPGGAAGHPLLADLPAPSPWPDGGHDVPITRNPPAP